MPAELFSKGVHEATGTFEIGNPDLAMEKASTIEIGLKRRNGRLSLRRLGLLHRVRRLHLQAADRRRCAATTLRPAAEDELEAGGLPAARRDVLRRGAGGAVRRRARLARPAGASTAQYDFVRAEFDNGENVPRIPPHRLGGGLFYRDVNWFAARRRAARLRPGRDRLQRDGDGGLHAARCEVSYTVPATSTRPR